jgi:hypothetical protein
MSRKKTTASRKLRACLTSFRRNRELRNEAVLAAFSFSLMLLLVFAHGLTGETGATPGQPILLLIGIIWGVLHIYRSVRECRPFPASALRGLTILWLCASGGSLLGMFSRGIFAYSTTHPYESFSIVAAVITAIAISKWLRRHDTAESRNSSMLAGGASAAFWHTTLTDEEAKSVAVHEAGHVLAHALINRRHLPPEFHATIVQTRDSLGSVRPKNIHKRALATAGMMRWSMMMCLAGRLAEIAIYKEGHSGSQSDMLRWQVEAERFLRDGLGGTFFSAHAAWEKEANVRAVEELKKSQTEIMLPFLTANRALLEELADRLVATKTLERDELCAFLDRAVAIPDGFPVEN